MKNRFLFFLAALFPLALAFRQLSHEMPFLQHELVGQAYWWTRSDVGFWNLLFDSERMDCYRGRFRYLEYLLQAAYWKAMAHGWLPRDIYDFSAVVLNGISGFLFYKISRKRGLAPIEVLLVLSLFFLSSQAYLTILFNFRKAKMLVSVLFLLLSWVAVKAGPASQTRRFSPLVLVLGAVGVITDPYFILLAPLLALGLDYTEKNKKFYLSVSVVCGLLLGAGWVVLLNGVIGPHFSENSGLVFKNLKGIPLDFLDYRNVVHFAEILPDLFFPYVSNDYFLAKAWLCLASFLSLIAALKFYGCQRLGIFMSLLAALPVCAFLIRPNQSIGFFSGYYGHPLLVLLTLCLIEVFSFLRERGSLLWTRFAYYSVLFLIFFHQMGKSRAYEVWLITYSSSPRMLDKVTRDYAELKNLNAHLKSHSSKPYALNLDKKGGLALPLAAGKYTDLNGQLMRTDFAYVFIPSIFKKELDSGQIVKAYF